MSDKWAKELAGAIEAVRAAARVCRAVQLKLATPEAMQKKDKSPVTVADFASQAVVAARLAELFPDDPLIGEEDSRELRADDQSTIRTAVVEQVRSERHGAGEEQVLAWIDRGGATGPAARAWTLDPIDGTKGFLRREQYAIALALIENGRVVLGVLACPNLALGGVTGVLMTARRGMGTRLLTLWDDNAAGQPARVAATRDTAGARFCESVESGHSDQDASAKIAATLGITAAPLRMDSQAKYATVAAGEASIYLRLPTRADYREKIWDHAAGAIVVEEAGGRVTDIDGKPLDFSLGRELTANRGIVATNGPIHDAVVAAVKSGH
ncbi:MAG: 3'(2'),5'-bisphosphate nucleotidase [Planctomycetes bacterium]|nr:3'(2'),5'-bisphosphate nucleotidase [Planctomycetota bacterium]